MRQSLPALRLISLGGALLAAACSTPPQGVARVEVDLPDQAAHLSGGPVAAASIHGDDFITANVLRLTAPIALHRHVQSEEVVYLLSGEGTLKLGNGDRALRVGDFVVVPRNTPHGFTPTGTEPMVVLQLFTPPFVDGDRLFEEAIAR